MLATGLASSEAMRGVYQDKILVASMLRFEAALAQVEAHHGLIPASAAGVITAVCADAVLDHAALASAAPLAGNLAIPLIKQLKDLVAARDAQAASFVHWGATSQDVIDSAAMLQARLGLEVLLEDIDGSARALAGIAEAYADTAMAGRTWLQHATPVSVGLKAAGWLSALLGMAPRLRQIGRDLPLQFGGASGTLAALGSNGDLVGSELATSLGLRMPDLPWHAERSVIAELASTLGILTGAFGKMARDVALLMQTEVGEMSEPSAPGKGGSSTMAHKRNPVGSAMALAAAARTPGLVATILSGMVQEHERGLGGWQAEWGVLPDLFLLASAASSAMRAVFEGLVIDRAALADNLELGGGLAMAEAATFALAEAIGRQSAQKVVEQAIDLVRRGEQPSLEDALFSIDEVSQVIDAKALALILQPESYLGSSAAMIERVLARYRQQLQHAGSEHG
jgi:3-carboxy-cis,cis-muconate cycloisomerase